MYNTQYVSAKPFSVYDYRSYEGYEVLPAKTNVGADVLCVGTCDLSSIRPLGTPAFTWADHLSKHYTCSQVSRACSLPSLVDLALTALYESAKAPKALCITLPIPAQQVVVDGLEFTISRNSARVARFALAKGLISPSSYERLLSFVAQCDATSHSSWVVKAHYRANLEVIACHCDAMGVRLLWCPNGTKTANEFFKYHIDHLKDDLRGLGTYVGWVQNVDLQPDSSLGTHTHEKLYEAFKAHLV